jgi:hypothetical protein
VQPVIHSEKVSRLNALAHAAAFAHDFVTAGPPQISGRIPTFGRIAFTSRKYLRVIISSRGRLPQRLFAMEAQVPSTGTASADGDDPANRRVARRVRTLKKGTIVIQGGYSVFDCVIRNISDTGAMLQVGGLGIPSHFTLKYDGPTPTHPCTVRWRTENAMGVSFDDVQMAA